MSSGSTMPAVRVPHRPDDAAQHAGGGLQARRVVLRAQRARLADGEARAVPVGVARVAREQHAQLVHARLDVLGAQLAPPLLQPPALPRQLVDRQHGVVARVVGVVHGRAVGDALALAHREVVGDGDRLAVGDEEAVVRAFERRPAAHARARPRPFEVDRRVAAVAVTVAVGGEVALVRAPAQLRRLAALAREPFHRPGVDELAGALRPWPTPACPARRRGSP